MASFLLSSPSQWRRLGSTTASQSYLDLSNGSYSGAEGAQRVVDIITSRAQVTSLLLNHSALHDDGCEVLFEFLCSEIGRRHNIMEIHLGSTQMGDRGLRALCRYLNGNTTLLNLALPNNAFTNNTELVSTFTDAINKSRVCMLALSSNSQLTDGFFIPFLSALMTPQLQCLLLAAVGLTELSVPALIDYISSPRSRALTELSLNSNNIPHTSVVQFLEAVRKHNYRLTRCELYANFESNLTPEAREHWRADQRFIQKLLSRNLLLSRQVHREAVWLLKHARPVLLGRTVDGSNSPRLPIELLVHILSYLSPSLSEAQCARVCNYAGDRSTLPPDPRRLPTLSRSVSNPFQNLKGRAGIVPPHANMVRTQGTMHWEVRMDWLKSVGCDAYEPDSGSLSYPT